MPALAAHRWSGADIATCLCAFFSFSLCASAVYITNDLIDLGRDRQHPTKRNRPFASVVTVGGEELLGVQDGVGVQT